MKKLFTVLTLFIALAALSACGNDDNYNSRDDSSSQEENDTSTEDEEENDTSTEDEDALQEFTLEELSQYDGKEGRKAYVAVDGDVYDVSESSYWNDGIHQGRIEAGQDLTEMIDNESPHGRSTLDRVPKIGFIVESDDVD